jgi:hypothetical protein
MKMNELLLVLFVCGFCLLDGCGGGSIGGNSAHVQPLVITSVAPPEGVVQEVYDASGGFSLTASGGAAPYTWSWTPAQGSSLPPGLSLSTDSDGTGAISGIPTTAGSYRLILKVTDSESSAVQTSANYTITVVVSGPTTLTITSGSPPDGTVGVNYGGAHTLKGHQYTGFPLSATGGVPSYTWSWAAAQDSSLPPGLQISDLYLGGGSTRCCLYVLIISGTPTVAGTYNVIVTVTDSGSPPAQTSADYAIAINP